MKRSSGVRIAGCSELSSHRKYSSSISKLNDRSRLRRRVRGAILNSVGLQPRFENGDLPQLRVSLWRKGLFRTVQQLRHVCRLEQLAFPRASVEHDFSDELQKPSAQIFQCGHWEVPLGPVDHL